MKVPIKFQHLATIIIWFDSKIKERKGPDRSINLRSRSTKRIRVHVERKDAIPVGPVDPDRCVRRLPRKGRVTRIRVVT